MYYLYGKINGEQKQKNINWKKIILKKMLSLLILLMAMLLLLNKYLFLLLISNMRLFQDLN